jgi:hypothetical protein
VVRRTCHRLAGINNVSFDFPAIYRSNRESFTTLVLGLDGEDLPTTVPATPLWTVKDAFAHVTGVASDYTTGRLDDAPSEPWTQRQVDERRDRAAREIAGEWTDLGPTIEAMLVPAALLVLHTTRHSLGRVSSERAATARSGNPSRTN